MNKEVRNVYTKRQVADILGVTPQRVQQLFYILKEGQDYYYVENKRHRTICLLTESGLTKLQEHKGKTKKKDGRGKLTTSG